MKSSELRQVLRAADDAAVLVSSRVLERIISQVASLPALVWEVPHRKCFVIDRHLLFRHAEQDELDLEPDQLLPPRVMLIARPSAETLAFHDRQEILVRYWRRLFHASIDRELQQIWPHTADNDEAIRKRVAVLGQAAFEEIRCVLDDDYWLIPNADSRTVYCEFVAVYLELRWFAPSQLAGYFPGLPSLDTVDALIAQDIDAEAIFRRTKLRGAPDDPKVVIRTDNQSDESQEYYWKLVRSAERADQAGNTVRAGILHTKAARVAPAALTQRSRDEADRMMAKLVHRLEAALHLTPETGREWLKDLPALLDKADQGNQPDEARLLFELQMICDDHERPIYILDLIEWASSGGKRPIKRPLPSQKLVRIIKRLRAASKRLTAARLADKDRKHLSALMTSALHECEDRLRERFRPLINSAFQDAGLTPKNAPEQNAFAKLIEELLDRIAHIGFLSFADVRDAISRNQLKMDDLLDAQEFVKGDPLLRLDRRLAALLDGVYRRSEFYIRGMERLTALLFGTTNGRYVTRNFLIPLFFGLFLLEGSILIFQHVGKLLLDYPAQHDTYGAYFLGLSPTPHTEKGELPFDRTPFWFLCWAFSAGGIWAYLRYQEVRSTLARGWKLFCRGVHWAFVTVPQWVMKHPTLREIIKSWPFQIIYSYLWKPLLVSGILWFYLPPLWDSWAAVTATLVAVSFVMNSRIGLMSQEAFVQFFAGGWHLLRSGLLPGLVRMVSATFKQLLDSIEYILFAVDEWLRYRGGDSKLSLVLRLVGGVVWFPIAYMLRFYTVVLIEPGFNPIKAPMSLLTAKFVYPVLIGMGLITMPEQWWNPFTADSILIPYFAKVMPNWLAWLLVISTLWFSPDAVTFLIWEMKENRRLYRTNRSRVLKPVVIGSHGEDLRGFLRPGFHSGTIPKLFNRLRAAEREASVTNNWRKVRAYREQLEEIKEAVKQFVNREFVTQLAQSSAWKETRFGVGSVTLATNRIGVELIHADHPEIPVLLEFEFRSGWLVSRLSRPGWFLSITAEQTAPLTSALAGLYKRAGLDFVWEHLQANLPRNVAHAEIVPEGVQLRTHDGAQLLYPLHDAGAEIGPVLPPRLEPIAGPVFTAPQLLFRQVELTWEQWVAGWQSDHQGQGHPPLQAGDRDLILVPAKGIPRNDLLPSLAS